MSDTNAAPGWYEQPGTPGRLRWWNGSEWTGHEAPLPSTGQRFRQLPDGVRSGTAWIWILVIGYHVAVVGSQILLARALPAALLSPSDPLAPSGDPAYLGSVGIGVAAYGAAAVLSALDRRELAVRGVDRPFAWAWSLLGVWVYLIGRTVVLRRRGAPDALPPLVVGIAGYVVALIVAFAVIISALAPVFAQLPGRTGAF